MGDRLDGPELNDTIATSAEEHGWKYVNGVRDNFYKHGICAEDDYLREHRRVEGHPGRHRRGVPPEHQGHISATPRRSASALRNVLGFPYSGPTYTGPMYAGTGAPQVCDTEGARRQPREQHRRPRHRSDRL